jgi:hypothetical protein
MTIFGLLDLYYVVLFFVLYFRRIILISFKMYCIFFQLVDRTCDDTKTLAAMTPMFGSSTPDRKFCLDFNLALVGMSQSNVLNKSLEAITTRRGKEQNRGGVRSLELTCASKCEPRASIPRDH